VQSCSLTTLRKIIHREQVWGKQWIGAILVLARVVAQVRRLVVRLLLG